MRGAMPSDKHRSPRSSLSRADDQSIFHADGDALVILEKFFVEQGQTMFTICDNITFFLTIGDQLN
jgi:hypothetical protein